MNNHLKLAYEAGAQLAIKVAREGWNVRDPDEDASDLFGVAGAVSPWRSSWSEHNPLYEHQDRQALPLGTRFTPPGEPVDVDPNWADYLQEREQPYSRWFADNLPPELVYEEPETGTEYPINNWRGTWDWRGRNPDRQGQALGVLESTWA